MDNTGNVKARIFIYRDLIFMRAVTKASSVGTVKNEFVLLNLDIM